MVDAKNMMAAADPQPRLLPHGVPGATFAAAHANLWLYTVHGGRYRSNGGWVGPGRSIDAAMMVGATVVSWDE